MSRSKTKYVDIPLIIDGNLKFVTGVSKYTTCADVIKMVLRKTEIGKENSTPDAFGIFKSSQGKQQLISTKSRILKVINSYGYEEKYELVFRKINTSVAKCSRMEYSQSRSMMVRSRSSNLKDYVHQQNPEDQHVFDMSSFGTISTGVCVRRIDANVSDVDVKRNKIGKSVDYKCGEFFCSSANQKTDIVKYAVRKTLKTKDCDKMAGYQSYRKNCEENGDRFCETLNTKVTEEKYITSNCHETLARDIVSKVTGMRDGKGKATILKKYFSDYLTYQSPSYKYCDTRYREQGDGAEGDTNTRFMRNTDTCQGYAVTSPDYSSRKELYYGDADESDDSGNDEDFSDFDTAFITNVLPASTNISRLEDSLISEVELEQALVRITPDGAESNPFSAKVGKLVDYSLSDGSLSDDSLLSDPSDISSISSDSNYIVHNVSSVSDIVKTAFDEQRDLNEDDEMESFMKTKLIDTSDEGLSSLGSDNERENIV